MNLGENWPDLLVLFEFQVLELQRRLDAARAQINKLPGISYNKDDQLERLELLRTQLKQKQQIIKKYRNLQFWSRQPIAERSSCCPDSWSTLLVRSSLTIWPTHIRYGGPLRWRSAHITGCRKRIRRCRSWSARGRCAPTSKRSRTMSKSKSKMWNGRRADTKNDMPPGASDACYLYVELM